MLRSAMKKCGARWAVTAEERADRGATLLEIIIAMVIIAVVAAGIMNAFVFSRQVTWRAGTELSGAGLTRQTVDELRQAITAPLPNGLTLQPGIYVDQVLGNAGNGAPVGSIPAAGLNFPAEFTRFQVTTNRNPDPQAANTPRLAGHGDGRVVVVENAPVDSNGNGTIDPNELAAVDLDGDGQAGQDLNGDGITDLRRVRVRVRWTSPTS